MSFVNYKRVVLKRNLIEAFFSGSYRNPAFQNLRFLFFCIKLFFCRSSSYFYRKLTHECTCLEFCTSSGSGTIQFILDFSLEKSLSLLKKCRNL